YQDARNGVDLPGNSFSIGSSLVEPEQASVTTLTSRRCDSSIFQNALCQRQLAEQVEVKKWSRKTAPLMPGNAELSGEVSNGDGIPSIRISSGICVVACAGKHHRNAAMRSSPAFAARRMTHPEGHAVL